MSNTTALGLPAQGPMAEHIAVAVVSALGVLLNSASLVVMLLHFTQIFSSIEACFVANLAVSDLLTSIGAFIWGVANGSSVPRVAQQILLIILWITVAASFLTLMCMACERLLVVVSPLKAQRNFKKSSAYICCAVVWFMAILTGSMIAVDYSVALFVMTVMFEISLIITLSCYAVIYYTIKRLRRDTSTVRYDGKQGTLNIAEGENETIIHHRVTVRQESRVTNMIFVLAVILAITVLPYMVLLQVNVTYLHFCSNCAVFQSLIKAQDYIFPIEMLNFMLNPVVYAWRLPKFRQAFKRTFGWFICCKSRKENVDGLAKNSSSSDSGSLNNGPATIFTGRETEVPLNNNSH